MANFVFLNLLLAFYLSCIFSLSNAQNAIQLPLKSVNLGNWLVIEGWMKPSLFDGIPNKDLLDGTQVQFKSAKLQKYLCPENGGGTVLVANRSSASSWETFRLWRINESSFNFRSFNKQFVGLENQGQGNTLVAVSNDPGNSENFQIVRNDADPNRVRIRAANGLFLQTQTETLVTANYEGSTWDDNDPSVFEMTIVSTIRGEYQISNGYDPERASQDHRNTYITEEDFSFMSSNGLNAVRIPIGWWIAYDPTPPTPFVGGSLQALDNAFQWAQNHGMKVIIDLHAVQGSQNGNEHSATRDGFQEWGSDSDIQDTVAVIDFLAARYANNPSLAAIGLMNEPMSPGVTLETLIRYYQMGYNTVRKYTSNAYVVLSNRLGPANSKELLSFAGSLSNVVVEVHYYNLYSESYRRMDVQQNINFIYHQRSSDLSALSVPNGPLSFVGEWSGEFGTPVKSKEDYQRFAEAQLDVYGRATFGWAFWAYKCDANLWSLKWMIENNYITL
ncbi:Glucan 1,3-beta-glucosidase A [Morus notabilis]|uniref:Glucan 1,3-beta-glucosidase A n=1 Tax=Morus notabilis TaxID=981085 RepID=W9R7H1_9ROSA|nr:Glucan 1,3-beta-glucosidase A [Morus notabilis]